MTLQRNRLGTRAIFYPVKKRIDNRGNERKMHDEDNPIVRTIWKIPQRGAKAEVTGQQTINVVRIGVSADVPGLGLNARVYFDDRMWDVVSPPTIRNAASRHTRHYMMDVRARPDSGGGD